MTESKTKTKTRARRAVTYMPLSVLQKAGDPKNPRAHESLTDVRESMDELGFIDLIVSDSRTGMLTAGHGRIKVLTDMHEDGAEPPEGVEIGDDGEWLVPVVTGWSSADDDAARRALLVLNRTPETGGWDDQKLIDLLEELDQANGLNATGFSAEDLDDYRAALDELASAASSGKNEKSYEDFLEKYTSRQVRGLVLDYDVDNYQWVLDALDKVRVKGESNAEVLRRLLADATDSEPPPLKGDDAEEKSDD